MTGVLSQTPIEMAATASASFSAPTWQRAFARAGPALPWSILLHAVLLYAVSRFSWIATLERVSEPPAVVWLNDWRPVEPEPVARAAPIVPVEPNAEAPAVPIGPPSEPAVDAPSPVAPLVETRSTEPEADAVAPTTEPRSIIVAPPVDWEKERKNAASRVVEDRALRESHRTFSLDDVPEDDHGVPARTPPTAIAEAVKNPCAIAHGWLQRFAMQMIGRCVRDARGDLFAHIKPGYLAMRPICAESVPEQPALAAERSQEFPTVKCRLAPRAEVEAVAAR
jgi:hypothetical protein